MGQSRNVPPILNPHWLIEPHLLLDSRKVFGGGQCSGFHEGWIARKDVREEKANQRHAEESRNREKEAAHKIDQERHRIIEFGTLSNGLGRNGASLLGSPPPRQLGSKPTRFTSCSSQIVPLLSTAVPYSGTLDVQSLKRGFYPSPLFA